MEGIHIAAFCSAALVLVLVILAAIAVYVRRKHPNWLSSSSASSTTSSPTILTPEITPKFIIPAYYAAAQEEHDEGKSGGGSSVEAGSFDGELRGPPIERSYSMPAKRTRGDLSQTTDDLTAMAARLYRPQYRRAMSSYVGASPGRRRKISVAPSGKLLVTLSFDAAKNLLVIEVNGTFDMPQVRMCGVSTPYVRVYLNQEDKATKEPRSAFLDLSCKRLCAFDRLTLEDAKNATLSFLVLDYDRFSRSDFIGEVTLPLSDVDLEKGATISRHLQPKTLEKGEDRGALVVSLCQQPSAGQLAVIVLKAEKLPLIHDATAPDTLVKVTYYVQEKAVDKKKTKVVKQTTCPVYNEPFVFDMKAEDLRTTHIVCEVFRAGNSSRRLEKIGHVSLGLESFGSELRHWNEMITSPQKQVAETHHLRA